MAPLPALASVLRQGLLWAMGRGRRNRKSSGPSLGTSGELLGAVRPASGQVVDEDEGWAVVGRRGRTLDESVVQRAATTQSDEAATSGTQVDALGYFTSFGQESEELCGGW